MLGLIVFWQITKKPSKSLISKFVYWYQPRSIDFLFNGLIICLFILLLVGFLMPESWWGSYSQPGIKFAEQIMMIIFSFLLPVVLPALFIPSWFNEYPIID
jgi:hypothetical protein